MGAKHCLDLRCILGGLLLLLSNIALNPVYATEAAIQAPLAISSLLLDGDQHHQQMVAVGERGHILVSQDKGHHWQQAQVPTRALLTAVHLHDQQLGWAVGHDATILKTVDGGHTWRQVFSAPEEEAPLLDVWFRDTNEGFAIGAYGLMYTSSDGGEHWQRAFINDEDDFHLNHLSQASDDTLYIVAEAGMVYRSDDGGKNWKHLESPYPGSFFGSLVTNNRIYIFGLRGHLFMSQDRGETWTRIPTHTDSMLTSAVKFKGSCIFSGLGGVLLIDAQCNGQDLITQHRPGREGISDLLVSDQDELVLIGEFGVQRYRP